MGTDNNDLAARIGITWKRSSKWVIRTGAGLFYSQDTGNPRLDLARNLAGRSQNNANTLFPDLTWENGLFSVVGGLGQAPSATYAKTGFGAVSTMKGNMRNLQLGLKYVF